MANQKCSFKTGTVTTVAATEKTIFAINPATNVRVKVLRVKIFGLASSAGPNTPLQARFVRFTAAQGGGSTNGTGTATTPIKGNPNNAETVQTATRTNFSVEPSGANAWTDASDEVDPNPQLWIDTVFPVGQEIDIPGGTSWGCAVTTVGGESVKASVWFEE